MSIFGIPKYSPGEGDENPIRKPKIFNQPKICTHKEVCSMWWLCQHCSVYVKLHSNSAHIKSVCCDCPKPCNIEVKKMTWEFIFKKEK